MMENVDADAVTSPMITLKLGLGWKGYRMNTIFMQARLEWKSVT
jgi:hypothetical protein